MRKLILRFIVALLCLALGIVVARLLTSSRPVQREQGVAFDRQSHSDIPTIADTVKSLRQIKTDQFDTKIPPAAKPLLTLLKHQLLGFIEAEICEFNIRPPAYVTEKNILSRLKDRGITVQGWEEVVYSDGFFQKPYTYGDIYGVTVEIPPGHPELRIVRTTLGVNCGEDTSLYVFQYNGSRWQMVLAQEANDYDEVSGAQGLFQYAVSPATSTGDFFVVTANVNPWCSSNWQTLRYKVLRPDPDSYRPRTLLSAEETIYLGGGDPPYRLSVKDDGFKLMFYGESNPDEVTRKSVVSYSVNGDRVTKVTR